MKRIFSLLLAFMLVVTAISFGGIEAKADFMKEPKTVYYVTFTPGSNGKGSSTTLGPYDVGTSMTLPDASSLGITAKEDGYVFSGWSLGSAGSTYTNNGSGSIGNDEQYYVTASAQWTKSGSSSSSSSSSSSTSSSTKKYTVTYYPGDATGTAVTRTYNYGESFTAISCPFSYKNHTFAGWEYGNGKVYDAGTKFNAPNTDIAFTATWENSGVTDIVPGSSSSSSSSSASSSASSSVSSSVSSSASSSSSKPSASSSSAPKPSSSSSSVVSSSESSSIESSSSSSVAEPSQPEVFEPVTLAFSIDGDVPVTKIEFILKEDLGLTRTLNLVPLDGYSAVDDAASKFIADGDALAAFDVTLVIDGLTHSGSVDGTVTYTLNGTQASASSNYGSYVLAMVHTVSAEKHIGEYYMTDGDNVYLYNPETDFKTAVSNVKLVKEDGVYRLVIKDTTDLSTFAYQASDDTIVEVQLVPSVSVSTASIDVTSLSPVLLAQIEVGSGKSGGGIPLWVWIVIAIVVFIVAALVAFYLINRNNSGSHSAPTHEKRVSAPRSSSVVTGFDDEE